MTVSTRFLNLGAVLAAAAAGPGCGKHASNAEGEALFRARCAVCHGQSGEGGQGPSLRGLAGRRAGGDPRFGYTPALRAAALTWDESTLDRFLAAPQAAVPGTNMVLATPDAGERKALVSHVLGLPAATQTAATGSAALPPAVAAVAPTPGLHVGRDAFGDYRSDAPGVRRKIAVADLPRPFATESTRNSAKVVEAPAGAVLHVPSGFAVAQFAKGLGHPRHLRVAPNGDVFIAASSAGEVQVIRPRADGSGGDAPSTFASGLDDPFGVAFYPAGPSPQWVYVADVNAVRRYPYASGDRVARGAADTVVAKLSPSTGGHTMRSLEFSADGKRMLVAVGSASNVAEDVPASTPEAIAAYEAVHGAGGTWGNEEDRADVLVFDPAGKNRGVFATGIRNCSGLTIEPTTGEAWCSTNERDRLGDDLVPDYVTRVHEHGFYGWPWYYLGANEDPRHAGKRKDLAGKVTVPDTLLQPHSAPLQLVFYAAPMFPAEYRGNAFVALHGSWNRAGRTGYKVVRVIAKDGVPTGEYEDFLTGFVVDNEHVWGRPVGVAVDRDGALLVSEDGNGTIWRIAYRGGNQ